MTSNNLITVLLWVLGAYSLLMGVMFVATYADTTSLISKGASEWGWCYSSIQAYWIVFLQDFSIVIVGLFGLGYCAKRHRPALAAVIFIGVATYEVLSNTLRGCGIS